MKTMRILIALLAGAALLLPTEALADKKYRRVYHHYHYGPGYGYYPYGYYDPYYAVPYGPVYGPGPYVYADPGVAAGAMFGGLIGGAIASNW